MPTTMLKRLPLPRDNRVTFALLGLMAIELLTLRVAGASTSSEDASALMKAFAPSPITCTVAEVPCHLLGP